MEDHVGSAETLLPIPTPATQFLDKLSSKYRTWRKCTYFTNLQAATS